MTAAALSTTAALIAGAGQRWTDATTADFLTGAADGTLPDQAFDRWLEQDRLFVQALVRAWGILLVQAPPGDFALLVGGLQAFTDELAWFQGIAEERELDLSVEPLPAAEAYNVALLELASRPYPEAITAMWAVEAAYLASWESTLPAHESFRQYAEHWANDDFTGFVAALAAVVDRELPDGPSAEAQTAFDEILEHETTFWRMTTGDT